MEIDYDKNQVPGYFLLEDVNFVRKEKGPFGITKLKKIFPEIDIDKISPFRKYPLKHELALLKAAAIIIYGDDSPTSWAKLGRHDFETMANSNLGKVLISLFGKDVVKLIKNASRFFHFFAPFITFSYQELDKHHAIFTIENDLYPREYYLGYFLALRDFIGSHGIITVKDAGGRKYIYEVYW